MSKQNDEYYNAVLKYYTMKNQYESYVKNQKTKHIAKDDTLDKKKQALSKIKYKCINCRKIGGTIFTEKNNTLMAVCGNTETPCKLNIKINKGVTKTLDYEVESLNDSIKKLKNKIILLKLDYIFNYIDKEKSLSEFQDINQQLNQLYEEYNKNLEIYLGITNNKEINSLIHEKNVESYKLIDEFKKIVNLYQTTREPSYIKDAIELYINKLVNLESELSELKYNRQFLQDESSYDDQNSCKKLFQLKYTKEDLEVVLEKNVESFVM